MRFRRGKHDLEYYDSETRNTHSVPGMADRQWQKICRRSGCGEEMGSSAKGAFLDTERGDQEM